MPIRRLSTALVLSALALASTARAGDAATAEALFRDGRALMDAGDYAAACPKLRESYVQDPATGTLLALALCQERGGLLASAWATYAEVVSRARAEGQADREALASERMSDLEPNLSRLTISMDARNATTPGLVVTRDGEAVGRPAWGTAVPLDPGEHTVEATAPGKQPFRTTVTMGARADAQSVTVPPLADAPSDRAADAPPAVTPSSAVDAGEPPAGMSTLRTVGLVVGGVGVVGLGLGGFFGLRASGLNDESNEDGRCDADQRCDPIGGEKRDDAIAAANIATVAFITGGVLAATGVTLFLVGGPRERAGQARLQATPLVAGGSGGLLVHGAF